MSEENTHVVNIEIPDRLQPVFNRFADNVETLAADLAIVKETQVQTRKLLNHALSRIQILEKMYDNKLKSFEVTLDNLRTALNDLIQQEESDE